MRILYVADWRSVIARSWITAVAEAGHECFVLSSSPSGPPATSVPLIAVADLPIGLSRVGQLARSASARSTGATRGPVRSTPWVARTRRRLAPWDLRAHTGPARRAVEVFQPDIVHGLRIPFEGIFAAMMRPDAPLVVSVWGNDFTLHAAASRRIARLTRKTVRAADGLVADCGRDIALAHQWGFPDPAPTMVAAGNGGLVVESADDLARRRRAARRRLGLAADAVVILSPRGPREYLRLDSLCAAVPRTLAADPRTLFVLVDVAGHRALTDQIDRLDVGDRCRSLGRQRPDEMADLFAAADVVVSPSTHDGIPNSLLEGLAAGCFPVVGDLPSVREWITDGINGSVCDPTDPAAIGAALRAAVGSDPLRDSAAYNRKLVGARADRSATTAAVTAFYRRLAAS